MSFIFLQTIGYQQFHCQGYQLFENFIKGTNGQNNWIGIENFGNNLDSAQNEISKVTYQTEYLSQLDKLKSKPDSEKEELQSKIDGLFKDFIGEKIEDPSIDVPSDDNNKLKIDDLIFLAGQKGFEKLKQQILDQDLKQIQYLEGKLYDLKKQSIDLYDKSTENSKILSQQKSIIQTFTKSVIKAQSQANDVFDQGSRYLLWFRVFLLICLGIILFCCLTTFIFFALIYFKKTKCLEPLLNSIWCITTLLAILGFFVAGIVYTTTIVFYEGSLSLDAFLTNQESYNKMSYFLVKYQQTFQIDKDAAKFTSDCIFKQSATLGDMFQLQPYFKQISLVSSYLVDIEEKFQGREYPNLATEDQIFDLSEYQLDLANFAKNQVKLRQDKFMNECNKKDNKCNLKDIFVLNVEKCNSDGKKRQILKQGDETKYLGLENCIIIDSTINLEALPVDGKFNYQSRIKENKENCLVYGECVNQQIKPLKKYSEKSSEILGKIMEKLIQTKRQLIDIYSNYYRIYDRNINPSFVKLLQSKFNLISDEKTGILKNTECTTFGVDMKTMHRFLSNQFIFEMYALDWWSISTFVGMIAGLFSMYFTISRLQFWANFEGQQIDEEEQDESMKPPEKSLKDILNKRVIKQQNKSNRSSLNESQLQSKLISQSAYQKKYVGGFRQSSNLSTNNFQYQVTLNDQNQGESPSNISLPVNMATSQIHTQTRSQYDIEMENYHN